MKIIYVSDCRECPRSGWSIRGFGYLFCEPANRQFLHAAGLIPEFCPLPVLACADCEAEVEVSNPGGMCADCEAALEMRKSKPPEINKRVIAWVEDEQYPFVGYWDGKEWRMETEYLNYDGHGNDIFGPVIYWKPLPERR